MPKYEQALNKPRNKKLRFKSKDSEQNRAIDCKRKKSISIDFKGSKRKSIKNMSESFKITRLN